MKVKKFWSMLALVTGMFAISSAMVSCGGDDDDVEGGDNGSGSGSGQVSANTIVGSYTAITAAEYTTKVVFSENGTGVITEKEIYEGKEYTYSKDFTYTVKGNEVLVNIHYSDNEIEPFKVAIVDGFVMLEEVDGDDIELILYKDGRDLGKGNVSKLAGTWGCSLKGTDWSDDITAVIKGDGTGTMTDVYKEEGHDVETMTANVVFKMRNAYVLDVNITVEDSKGNKETRDGVAAYINNQIYLLDNDGECDDHAILKKK